MATLKSSPGARAPASPVEVTIPFSIHAETRDVSAPISVGLCLPRGRMLDATAASVVFETSRDHKKIHADVQVSGRWQDGSVRWVLLDFIAKDLPCGPTAVSATLIDRTPGESHTSEALSRVVARTNGLLVQMNGQAIDVSVVLEDHEDHSLDLYVSSTMQEKTGLNCHRWNSIFHPAGQTDIELRVALDVWPQEGIIDISTRIRNSRRAIHNGGLWDLCDKGSFHFRDLTFQIRLQDENREASEPLFFSIDCDCGSESKAQAVSVTQKSSGGPNWNCSNHVGSNGRIAVDSNGYELVVDDVVSSGLQASPSVMLVSNTGSVGVAVPEFWQQFPGRIACDASAKTVSVGLFPKESAVPFELQGGEQKTKRFVIQTSPRPTRSPLSYLSWVHSPPRYLPDLSWVRKCNVIPWLPAASRGLAPSGQHRQRLSSYLAEATTKKYSVSSRRDAIDEYGWRNFGDFHADHEQTHFIGDGTVVSHYNNQFDLIFGAIQNLIVEGDARWYDLFDPLARHVMDIDIYHTKQDRACFNGGLFWHTDHYVDAHTATHRTYSAKNAGGGEYGGGPSNEHNYPTGLLFYHYLTGSDEAKDSVISLADWVINMDDGTQTIFGVIDGDDTGLASKTVSEDFHGPGRGVGNSINACLDGWLLTSEMKYLEKADCLIRRAVHPCQDLDALHLADAEGHWSYTVCLTALGRYLHVKAADDRLDEMYEYVRQTLVHYGLWMEQKEKPSLSVPEDLEFPTEAWAAQDFRKANVLRIAASCCQDDSAAERMRRAANRIHEAAWTDLYQFGQAHLTARCLSIIMTEGLREVYHETEQQPVLPPGKPIALEQNWAMFELQKHRVKNTLKNPIQLLKAVITHVRPNSIRQSLQAFRRQTQS